VVEQPAGFFDHEEGVDDGADCEQANPEIAGPRFRLQLCIVVGSVDEKQARRQKDDCFVSDLHTIVDGVFKGLVSDEVDQHQ